MTTFDDIFGQDAALNALREMHAEDRLPHGLIFAGAVGVGKATTAAALAAFFLCEKPSKDKPCGRCGSCRVFAAGNHPDYHVIVKEMIRLYDKTGVSKATELSINVIRPELIDKASLKTSMGRGKVFVIEQADFMTIAAQNAALKTLEEPNGRTIIILLTDQELSLLPTIRSRCQVVRFGPLDPKLVVTELTNRQFSKTDAADAADFADGSLGLAIRWLDDGVVPRGREMLRIIDGLLAGRGAGALSDWLRASADEYAAKQLDRDPLTSKPQASRDATIIYLRLAAQILRRRMGTTDDPAALERLCAGIDALVQAEQYLDANVTVALIFQQLAVRLEILFSAG